jgi:hypothetical protein
MADSKRRHICYVHTLSVYVIGFTRGNINVSHFVLYKCFVERGALSEVQGSINTVSVQ